MQITVQLPDDLIQHPNPAREALEALVIKGYRSEAFSHAQASELLGFTRAEFDGFLTEHNIDDHAYNEEDLAQETETSGNFESGRCSAHDRRRG